MTNSESQISTDELYSAVKVLLKEVQCLQADIAELRRMRELDNRYHSNVAGETDLLLFELAVKTMPEVIHFECDVANIIGRADCSAPERFKSPPPRNS